MDIIENKPIVRKVLVLYVGGTIGMIRNQFGVLGPKANIFREKLKQISQLHDNSYIESQSKERDVLALPLFAGKYRVVYDIKEFNPLLDSSSMGIEHWKRIAIIIKDKYSYYDGFVVAHGTDTLVYTASALSFMFENLEKPIIATGSQIPIYDSRSDGVHNLLHSIIFAGTFHIPEVCIFFGKVLLRGNRSTKISSDSFDAFESPNMDPLAFVGSEINLRLPEYQPSSNKECILHTDLSANVVILIIYPEMSEKLVRSVFEAPVEGVILLTYGSGNIPSNKGYILEAIRNAVDRGIMVINCSQCIKGTVRSIYETHRVLTNNGAISAFDMTMEAAYTKLLHVLPFKNLSYSEKRKMMENSLRGELTN